MGRERMFGGFWTVPFVSLLVASSVVVWAGSAAAFRQLEEGSTPPAFRLTSVAGEEVGTQNFTGKTVIISFVRQGQEKSAKVLSDLARLSPELSAVASVLAVVTNPADGDAKAWAEGLSLEYPVVLDSEGEVYGLYGVLVTPSTGVVDAQGLYRGSVNGHTSSFGAEIEQLGMVAAGLTSEDEASAEPAEESAQKSEERKTAERHLEKAKILGKRKMKDKAAAAAQEAVDADGEYVDARLLLADSLLDVSDENATQALPHYEKVLELEPKNVDAKVGVARVKSLQGDFDGAAEMLQKAVMLNPRPEKVYYQLGLVYERADKYKEAVEAYRKALEKLLR